MSILTKRIWILSFISLLTDVASEMLYPVMPLYLKDIGFKMAFIGFLEGLAELVAGFSKGYFGQMSDRLQQRTVFVRWGYGISGLAKPLIVVFKTWWWVLAMRTADRLGKGIRTSARDALLADESTPENRGRVFGFHRMMDTTGAALGPLAALLFLSASPGNYTELFYFSAIPGVFALALSFKLKESKNRPKPGAQGKKVGFTDYIKYWKKSNSNYRKTVGGLVAFSLFNSSDVFLLLLLKSKGFSDVSVIGVYIFYNLVYAALSYPFGRLSDRLGYRKIFMLGLAGFAITYASVSFIDNYYEIIGLFGVYGAYAALTEGTSRAWISNLCRPEEKATAFGFYNSFSSFALIIASTLTGFIWDYTLPVYCFTVSAIGAVLCLLYFSAIKQD